MDFIHQSNITIHVISGTIAILLGLLALLSLKGGVIHNRSGRIFLIFLFIVITTGLIGVFVFKVNAFLLVITTLSGYVGFSGFRVLQTKSNEPKALEILVSFLTLLALGYFKSIGMIWSPIIIYSTVGAVLFVIIYDFIRYLIPKQTYKSKRIWLFEHIYKMTSAFSALLSAFAGTVLVEYQPESQYLPSALGMVIIIGFMIYVGIYGLKRYRVKQL